VYHGLVIEHIAPDDADLAIAHIHRRYYPNMLEHYKGTLILVGIYYDKEVQ
jgi:hypothetical protein